MKFLLASLLLYSALCTAGPCESEQHNAFDFWLGQWQVFKPDGSLAGYNTISKQHNNCVLHERYSTPSGFSGESLNIYDASRGLWHQSWMDNTGTLLLLEGSFSNGSMILTGRSHTADGKTLWHQIHWTPNSDGSVRQHWQTKSDGAEWQTVFDGLYRKQPPGLP
jgi:hypothetical protein